MRYAVFLVGIFCALNIGCATSVATSHAPFEIITFGPNDADWNERLIVTSLRIGCSGTPENCMAMAGRLAADQGVGTIYLSVPLTPNSPEHFAQLRELAAMRPELREVGIDDFVAAYDRLARSEKGYSETLEQAIRQLKANGSTLQFGITLYENELDHRRLGNKEFPPHVRALVDNVHLYLHYRRAAPGYRKFVMQTKRLFPNARVIAGSYAYDRIDYLPCDINSKDPCSVQDEIDLFSAALDEQIALLKNREVSAIEFYPAQFGEEEDWRGWERTRICRPENHERCIETTHRMRQIVLERLAELHGDNVAN